MELFFLSANKPIAKTYRLNDRKKVKKENYPFVHRFTSFQYTIETLLDFHLCMTQHADHGNCLLKGVLQRPLKDESRAGTTSPETHTQWICLDFDGITSYISVDEALEAMGCGNTDYILQWSASHGIEEKPGLNCHIFMLLEEPQHPTLLKQWLKHINLSTNFRNDLELAKSGNALVWKLDITTCQNDKLLYIAKPIFGKGVDDPVKDKRISFIERTFRTLELNLGRIPAPSLIQAEELKALNKARENAGYKSRKLSKYSSEMDVKYLVKPDSAQVTGIKTERDFVYFNLNGGDSWGYYHPVSNPTFIFNFKGEPTYRTQDLLPAYWEEIRARVVNLEPDAAGSVYLAFRDFESATYWNGIYNAPGDKITRLAQAKSESQLRHFMKQHGQPIGDFIPDWEMKFNPAAKFVIDQKRKRLNTYRPSQYFSRPPVHQDKVPPVVAKVIYHALGSDDTAYEAFLNWLAVIAQTLGMTQTAWVIHGTQGTGKGVMFNHILTPLFGQDNVTSRRMEELGSNFTEFMKDKFIVFIDEVSAGNSLFHDKVTSKLKNLIVEPRISVREMYRPSAIMENYTNLIFASNSPRPVSIAADDRRFNVGKYQEKPLRLTSVHIDTLASELGSFYDYLHTRSADRALARTPLESFDRDNIINLSRPSIDIAIEALKRGQLTFFKEMLMDRVELLSPKSQLVYDQYRTLIEELDVTRRLKLTRDDLFVIFRWCIDNVPEAPNKFTTMLRHHGLQLGPIWDGAKTIRGFEVKQWN